MLPCTTAATSPRIGRVVVLVAGSCSVRDFAGLLGDGSAALLNVRAGRPSHGLEPGSKAGFEAGCLSLGASAMATGGAEVRRAGDANGAIDGSRVRDAFEYRTGTDPGAAMVLHPEIALMRRANEEASYRATPGALGSALHRAGIRTAAIGCSDIPDEIHREVVAAAMDERGLVDYGEVDSAGLLERDPSAPYGVRTNPAMLLAAYDALPRDCRFVAIDYGDTFRADAYCEFCTDEQAAAIKQAADARVAEFVRKLRERLDPERDLLIVLSPNPRSFTEMEGERLGAIVIYGPGFGEGVLTSPSTRRVGVVTLADVAPTVLGFLGVEPGEEMVGRTMRSFAGPLPNPPHSGEGVAGPHPNPPHTGEGVAGPLPNPPRGDEGVEGPLPNPPRSGEGVAGPLPNPPRGGEGVAGPLPNPPHNGEGVAGPHPNPPRGGEGVGQFLLAMNADACAQAQRQVIMRWASVAQSVIVVLLLAAVLLTGLPAVKRLAAWMAISFAAIPFAMLVMPLICSVGVVGSTLALVGLVLATIGLCALVFRSPSRAFVWLCAAIVIGLMIDLLRGAPLIDASIAGYNIVEGARYYGIGNELMGTMLGAAIAGVGMALAAGRIGKRMAGLAAVIVLGATFVFIGAPFAGANMGGALAVAPAIGVVLLVRRGWRPSGRGVALIALATILLVGGLFAADAVRSGAAQTHAGQTVAMVKGHAGGLPAVVERKLALNCMLVVTSVWSRLLGLCLAGSAALVWWGRREGVVLGREENAAAAGCLVGTVGAFVFNDSGVVAGATCSVFLFALLALKVLEDRKSGREAGST